jgi:hypothetical protein
MCDAPLPVAAALCRRRFSAWWFSRASASIVTLAPRAVPIGSSAIALLWLAFGTHAKLEAPPDSLIERWICVVQLGRELFSRRSKFGDHLAHSRCNLFRRHPFAQSIDRERADRIA